MGTRGVWSREQGWGGCCLEDAGEFRWCGGGTRSGAVERMVALGDVQGAMRRGGCARWVMHGSHRGASQAYPSICGTKGGDVAARGRSRRVWVALLGSRGAREETQPRGCRGRGHSLEADHLLGQVGGIQAKAPQDFSVRIRFPVKCQHGSYSIAAACAQHQLAAGSMLCCQRLAELPCPAGASPGDLRGQPGVTAGTGER